MRSRTKRLPTASGCAPAACPDRHLPARRASRTAAHARALRNRSESRTTDKTAAAPGSTDAWQRVADEHVDHTAAAECSVEQDEARRIIAHLADDHRVAPERMRAKRGKRRLAVLGGDDRNELSLVC